MGEFRMPSLGADMDAGTIVEWRVHPGDEVHRGDVVAVVDTDKADIDAEIFEDGVIGELLVQEGEKVPVGTVLALVNTNGAPPAPAPEPATVVHRPPPAAEPVHERPPEAAPSHVLSPVVRHLAERNHVDLTSMHGSGVGGTITRADVEHAVPRATGVHPHDRTVTSVHTSRPRVSPRARRLAAEAGVDVAMLTGSGPGGAIVGADIGAPTPAAAPAPKPKVERVEREDRSVTMQRRIAALMERSNREIPHYWVTRDIDFSPAATWLTSYNESRPPEQRLVGAALLLTATARAATAVPKFNGWWSDGRLEESPTVELGIVIVLRGGGLLVPVVHAAETLTASQTMAQMAELVRRARSGHLRSSDLATPTLTVSNLGDQGADEVLGVIYPPQVALIGFGCVRERPWAEGGMVGVRRVVTASVAGDHRASEGHQASRFLATVDQLLQAPESLEESPS